MGLSSAMYTGLSGLNANQSRIETIGNNIANVNTNAYRGSRTMFQTQFARTLSAGTPPNDQSGGTNPMQYGLGTLVATTQRTTSSPGSLETTGIASDLAVEGAGYFIVRDAEGRPYYTRDGAFTLDANNQLVNANGYRVRGFGVDETYTVVPGQLTDITIPIGTEDVARATENSIMTGDLSAAETIATAGSETVTQALVDGGGAPAAAGTLLTDLRSATNAGTVMFADGNTITVSGVTKGGREVPSAQFVVGTDGNTLGDFANWLQSTLGIQTTAGLPGTPGVVVQGGMLKIRSNAGEPLAFEVTHNDFASTNENVALPFEFTQTAEAQGGGVFTSMTVYDSLGNPVPVHVTFTLEETSDTGPVWRYYVEQAEAGKPRQTLGSGTISFDPEGNYLRAEGNQISIDRSNTGALTPQLVTLDFSTLNGLSTRASEVIMADQDGYPPGTLVNYNVGVDGEISGTFSNGQVRTLGQVALATFINESGLVAEAENLYSLGPNSGAAEIKAPGTLGAGSVRGGALEMSNVDLSREFIGLITSSTGFQAASRVISVSNEMLDQLLLTLR